MSKPYHWRYETHNPNQCRHNKTIEDIKAVIENGEKFNGVFKRIEKWDKEYYDIKKEQYWEHIKKAGHYLNEPRIFVMERYIVKNSVFFSFFFSFFYKPKLNGTVCYALHTKI